MNTNFKLAILTGFLVSVISLWFYSNSKLRIEYDQHPQLTVGDRHIDPRDAMYLDKVIRPPPGYIESTNAQQRLYDLEYNLNFENPIQIGHKYSRKEDLELSGWPVANQTRCGQQLEWLIDQLTSHTDYMTMKGQLGYELTSLVDSIGRPQAGLFSGIINWDGLYKTCRKLSLNNGEIKTRYCIGMLRLKNWPKNETIYPPTSIRVGLCLPETCDTLSFNQYHSSIEKLLKFEWSENFKNELDLDSMFCLPDERSPIRQMPLVGRVVIYIVVIWVAFVLLASLIHELRFRTKAPKTHSILHPIQAKRLHIEDKPANPTDNSLNPVGETSFIGKLLETVSIRETIKSIKEDVFSQRRSLGEKVRVHMGFMDAVKVLMTILVVLVHGCYLVFTLSGSLSNRLDFAVDTVSIAGFGLARVIDTFFVFGGTLGSYTLLRKFKIDQLSNPLLWIAVNVLVLVKIGPMYGLVYWYSRSISPYIGHGPYWDYGVYKWSMKGVCMRDPWWKSIPHLTSIGYPHVPACILPSWFLVSHLQIALLIPLITYLIAKLPKTLLKFGLIGFITAASGGSLALRLYQQTTFNKDGINIYGMFLIHLMEKFESTGHTTTFSRVGTVAIGCLVGYLLRMYEVGKIRDWPRWFKHRSIVFITILILVILGILPIVGQLSAKSVNFQEFIISNIAILFLWPTTTAILTLLLATTYNDSLIIRFASHRFFHAFNRLGLSIFLIHWEVVYTNIAMSDFTPTYGYLSDGLKLWGYGYVISVIAALVIYIFIESPLLKISILILTPFVGAPSSFNQEKRASNGSNKMEST